jgi:hypothetical protein
MAKKIKLEKIEKKQFSKKWRINKEDVISSVRNWLLVSGASLVVYMDIFTNFAYTGEFDWNRFREFAVLSILSFFAFIIKRAVMGEKSLKK